MTAPTRTPTAAACAAALQTALADLTGLALTAKQLHWTVRGPQFIAVHELLDRITDVARDRYDQVAERLAALGVVPDGRAATVAASPAAQVDAGWVADTVAIETIHTVLVEVGGRIRRALPAVEDGDAVTHDLLVSTLGDLEHLDWFVVSHRPVS